MRLSAVLRLRLPLSWSQGGGSCSGRHVHQEAEDKVTEQKGKGSQEGDYVQLAFRTIRKGE